MNTIRPLPTLDDIKRLVEELGVTFTRDRDAFDLDKHEGWEIHGTYRNNQAGYNAAFSSLVRLQESQRNATKEISSLAKRLIVAGQITDEAGAFLLAHGAHITGCLDLTLITLPDDAAIEKTAHPGQYRIGLWTLDEGALENDVILVDVAINVYETKVMLDKDHWATE